MERLVFAASLIAERSRPSRPDPRALELLYSGADRGLGDVVRVVAAIGGIALVAGLLSAAGG